MIEGKIYAGVGGFYTVRGQDGADYTLRARGKLRREELKPRIGDEVDFTPGLNGANGWVEGIHPRRNSLTRPSVSNVDIIAVVIAARSPEPDYALIDRLMVAARSEDIEPIIVVNKCELSAADAAEAAENYRGGAEVFVVSALSGEGNSALRAAIAGAVVAFAGQSGVGKSTLLNALYELKLNTGDISMRTEHGKHTTRSVNLFPVLGGGMVLDTPGFSLIELKLMEPTLLMGYYPDFAGAGDCRFAPCSHRSEPGCRVRAAVDNGGIPRARWERYKEIYAELSERWAGRYG